MKYVTNESNHARRKRKRKIYWFNPPFSKTVKTNIGKIFLGLINRHFDETHILRKYFNQNTVKISYRTLNNVKKLEFRKCKEPFLKKLTNEISDMKKNQYDLRNK